MSSIEVLPDPCPLPEHLAEKKRHKLNARERIIYAPMSDVGGLVYDKDATFVDIGPQTSQDLQNPRVALLQDLKALPSLGGAGDGVDDFGSDDGNDGGAFRLFADSNVWTAEDVQNVTQEVRGAVGWGGLWVVFSRI